MPDLGAVDFNSIRALHALLTTQSVTEASARLGTTQPQMSRTLARLRAHFSDPLLVRSGRALVPTPLARSLIEPVESALASLRAVFSPAAAAPQTRFKIAASDYAIEVVLLPWLAAQPAGPGLTFAPLGLETISALVRGEVDLAIAPRADVEGIEQLVFRPLLKDHYAVAMRRGHPMARGKLTLARYLACEHVAVERGIPGPSSVHRALARLDRNRRVALRVPSLHAALSTALRSDLITALPLRFVRACDRDAVVRPLPFAVEPLAFHLVFHPRWSTEPAHRALRESIARSIS
jgi:DNA-binding transcriptional LysR family regulator